jgi:hypothetical protein
MYYEGADTCKSEDMYAPRRVYVLTVCAGLEPAAVPFVHTEVPLGLLPARWNARGAAARQRDASELTAAAAAAGTELATVLHVEERGLCSYFVWTSSVLACPTKVLAGVRAALDALPLSASSSSEQQMLDGDAG